MPYRSPSDSLLDAKAAVASRDSLSARGTALEAQLRSLRQQREGALASLRAAGRDPIADSAARPPRGTEPSAAVEVAQAHRAFTTLDHAIRETQQAWAEARRALDALGDVDRQYRRALERKLSQLSDVHPALRRRLDTMLDTLARGVKIRARRVETLRMGDVSVSALIRANGQLRATLRETQAGGALGRATLLRCASVLDRAAEDIAPLQRRLETLEGAPAPGLELLAFAPPKNHWTAAVFGRADVHRRLDASRERVANVRANLVRVLDMLRDQARAHDQTLTAVWNELCSTAEQL